MNFFISLSLFFNFFCIVSPQIYTPIDNNFKNIITSKILSSERIINGFIYKFDDKDIFNTLKTVKNKGVKLDFICDKNSFDYANKLTNATLFDNMKPYDKLHAKSLLFDNKTLLIGSFNLDKTTFSTNFEIMLETTEKLYIDNFLQKFNQLKLILNF